MICNRQQTHAMTQRPQLTWCSCLPSRHLRDHNLLYVLLELNGPKWIFSLFGSIVCEPWSWLVHHVHGPFNPFNPFSISSWCSIWTTSKSSSPHLTWQSCCHAIGLLANCVDKQLNASPSKESSECGVKIDSCFLSFFFYSCTAVSACWWKPESGHVVACQLWELTHGHTRFRESPAFPAPAAGALTGRPRHRLMMSSGRFQLGSWASAVRTAWRQRQVLHIAVAVTHTHTRSHTRSKPRPCGRQESCGTQNQE